MRVSITDKQIKYLKSLGLPEETLKQASIPSFDDHPVDNFPKAISKWKIIAASHLTAAVIYLIIDGFIL